jgi:hypothetical protein
VFSTTSCSLVQKNNYAHFGENDIVNTQQPHLFLSRFRVKRKDSYPIKTAKLASLLAALILLLHCTIQVRGFLGCAYMRENPTILQSFLQSLQPPPALCVPSFADTKHHKYANANTRHGTTQRTSLDYKFPGQYIPTHTRTHAHKGFQRTTHKDQPDRRLSFFPTLVSLIDFRCKT